MKTKFKGILILSLGWVFILLGIAGLFLPIVQGILFLLIGLYLLSLQSAWARKIFNKLRHRYPTLDHKFSEIKVRNKNWLKRIFGSKV